MLIDSLPAGGAFEAAETAFPSNGCKQSSAAL